MSCALMEVSAHRSLDDAKSQRLPIVKAVDGHLGRFYRVHYRIPTLGGAGKYSNSTTIVIDLAANGGYPLSEPACWVISQPMPWSPHFREGSVICLGELWTERKGQILLGHLLGHIARLLNWDEIARDGGYVGWNGAAIRYWEKELGRQPITPGLVYPIPDARLTHGLDPSTSVFRSVREAKPPTVFRGHRAG
jgi:hypothetical protein